MLPPSASRGISVSRPRQGFSLVEVVLALGVASFALMTMFGTMAVGLTAIKDASDDTLHAQIMAQVASTVQQTPFNTLESFVSSDGTVYFDQSGQKVDSAGQSIYRANLDFEAGSEATYPGAPAGLNASANVVAITVSTQPPGAQKPTAISRTRIIVPNS